MTKRLKDGLGIVAVFAFFLIYIVPVVNAQTLQSPNYQFDESSIGAGGLVQSSSPNFQGTSTAGDLGVGNAASSNYQIDTGSETTADPRLSVAITNADANFGAFSADVTAAATATFSVLNYTSYGYVVQIAGDTPNNSGHVIPAIDTGGDATAEPTLGQEEFGVNVVANVVSSASPTSFGANPDQGQFGEGEASPNYGTSGQFRYVSGETIALAPKSSGVTIYTISYLVNVEALTPGGDYTSNQILIVTGTY
jgi:hypothetical protein